MFDYLLLFNKIINKASNIFMFISAVCLSLMLILINVEVVGRYVFNYSTLIADEYGGYLFSMLTMLGLVYSLHRGQFLRVTFLSSKLSLRIQVYLYLIASILGVIFSVIVTYEIAKVSTISWEFGSKSIGSNTPLFFPQIIMPIGMAIISVEFLNQASKSILKIMGHHIDDNSGGEE